MYTHIWRPVEDKGHIGHTADTKVGHSLFEGQEAEAKEAYYQSYSREIEIQYRPPDVKSHQPGRGRSFAVAVSRVMLGFCPKLMGTEEQMSYRGRD